MRKLYVTVMLCALLPMTMMAQTKVKTKAKAKPAPVIYYVEDSTAQVTVYTDGKLTNMMSSNDANQNKEANVSYGSADFAVIDGTIKRPNNSTFKVVEVPGLTKTELCDKICNSLAQVYGSADKIRKDMNGESVTVSTTATNMAYISITEHMAPIKVDGNYNMRFQFKDGEVIIDAPEVTSVKSRELNFDKSAIAINLKELATLDPNGVQGFTAYLNDKIDTVLTRSFGNTAND